MQTRRNLFVLLACASGVAGFGPCTSGEPVVPLPPQPLTCVELLDESDCTARSDCRAIYTSNVCDAPQGVGCDPVDPNQTNVFVGCQDVDACEQHDEAACISDPACEPSYIYGDCPATDPGTGGGGAECPAPDCGGVPPPPCDPVVTYNGCHERTVCPAVLCDIWCEYGNAVDENGCATCACNPPPGPCSGLDEQQCISTPGCGPVYGGGGCSCPDCDPSMGGNCAPCGCDDPNGNGFRVPEEYQGCVQIDPCAGLDENICIATPGCSPTYYTDGGCVCPACEPGGECAPCECNGGGAAPPPDGDRRPPPPTNPNYAGCVSSPGFCSQFGEEQCLSTPGCIAEYSVCGKPDPGAPFCDSSDPNCTEPAPCPPPTFIGCHDAGTTPGCAGDAECPNGYCEAYATCAALGCPPPPPSQCVYPNCDDGQPVLCDALPPICAPGEVAAARNGCWACVDARTCGSTPPAWCASDADCSHGYCDTSGMGGGGSSDPDPNGGGAGFPAPAGQCVQVSCDDGSQLMCRALEPDCGPGFVSAVINGCWQCRDARTCL